MEVIIKKWFKVGNGIQNAINCIFEYQNELYVIGEFTSIDNLQINNIAKWNGDTWNIVLDESIGTINYGCAFNNELYIAGNFNTTSNIRKYNGTSWSDVGTFKQKEVFKLKVENNQLFAMCQITSSDLDGIFEYNNDDWIHPNIENILGESLNSNTKINDIVLFNNQYYIAKGTCTSLCVFEDKLVTGGLFNTLNGNTITMNEISNTVLKQFDGLQWSLVGGGIPTKLTGIDVNSEINSLLVYEDDINSSLYVAGNFNRVETTNRNLGEQSISINRWNGEIWQNLGYKNSTIKIKTIFGYTNNETDSQIRNGIYIGGLFASLPDVYSNNIAVYSTQTDEDLDTLLNPTSDSKCQPIVPCGFTIERPPSNICQTGTLIPGPPGPQGQPGPPGPAGNPGESGTTYTSGNGINISDSDVISVDIDDIAGYGLKNSDNNNNINNKLNIDCDVVSDCVLSSPEGKPINIVCEELSKRGTTYIVFLRKDIEEAAVFNDPLEYTQWITPDAPGCDSNQCVGGDNDPECCGQNGGSNAIKEYWGSWDGQGNPNTLPTKTVDGETVVDVSQIVPGSMVMDLANRIYFLPNPEFTSCIPECDYYSNNTDLDPGPIGGETDIVGGETDIVVPTCNNVTLQQPTLTINRIDELGVGNGFNQNPGKGQITLDSGNNPIYDPSWCWVSFVRYPDGSTNDDWLILGDTPDTNGFDYTTGTVEENNIDNQIRFSIEKQSRTELYNIIQGTCLTGSNRTAEIVVGIIDDDGNLVNESIKTIEINQCVTGCSAYPNYSTVYLDRNGYVIYFEKSLDTGCLIEGDCVVNAYTFDPLIYLPGFSFNSKEFETSELTPYDCCQWRVKGKVGFKVTFDTDGERQDEQVTSAELSTWIAETSSETGFVNSDLGNIDPPICDSQELNYSPTPHENLDFVREIIIRFDNFADDGFTTIEPIKIIQFSDIDLTETDFDIDNPDYLINKYYNV